MYFFGPFELLLPLLALFYFIVMPILLFTTRSRLRALERKLEGNVTVRKGSKAKEEAFDDMPDYRERPSVKRTPVVSAQKRTSEKLRDNSLEERVGGHWFQWLGVAALVFALLFFLKWSFDNGWIGPAGRTMIGYLLCAVAMVAGDQLRSRYGKWSLTFTGGGALGAFIVTWIGLHTYGLFPSSVAFVLYVLITLVTCVLAGRYNSLPLAAFGVIGAFLIPMLTDQSGTITSALLFILILDVGVLVLAHMRQWRGLHALALLGTLAYEVTAAGYYCTESALHAYPELAGNCMERPTALVFLALFMGIYTLVPVVYNIWRKERGTSEDVIILVFNALAHFGLVLWWLGMTAYTRQQWDAPVSLLFAAIFAGMSVGLYKANRNDSPLVLGALSLTVLFASLAIPFQLGDMWVPLAWSIESVFLLWMALELKDKRMMSLAFATMFIAYVWYLFVPTETGFFVGDTIVFFVPPLFLDSGIWLFLIWMLLFVGIAAYGLRRNDAEEYGLVPFAFAGLAVLTFGYGMRVFGEFGDIGELTTLQRFIEAASLIGGSYVVLWQARERWSDLSPKERSLFVGLGIAVQIVTLCYLTNEYVRAVNDHVIFASAQRPWQIVRVGTSILWAVYASAALIAGMARQWRSIRLFSIVVLLIATLKLALFDFFDLGTGYRVIGFTVLGVILVTASILYQRNKDTMKNLLK